MKNRSFYIIVIAFIAVSFCFLIAFSTCAKKDKNTSEKVTETTEITTESTTTTTSISTTSTSTSTSTNTTTTTTTTTEPETEVINYDNEPDDVATPDYNNNVNVENNYVEEVPKNNVNTNEPSVSNPITEAPAPEPTNPPEPVVTPTEAPNNNSNYAYGTVLAYRPEGSLKNWESVYTEIHDDGTISCLSLGGSEVYNLIMGYLQNNGLPSPGSYEYYVYVG